MYASNPQDLQSTLQRVRLGEQDAMAEAFDHYRDHLRRMVDFRLDRRLAGRVDASDIVQEAYIDAVKRLPHFVKGDSVSFLGWLRKVAEQTMIDVHRRHLGSQMRDVRKEVTLGDNLYSPATAACLIADLLGNVSSPSQKASQAEAEERIVHALNQMDPIDREVLVLRHFEELTNNEVAEVLGLKPSAASNRYFRALKRLKAVLATMPELFAEYLEPQSDN